MIVIIYVIFNPEKDTVIDSRCEHIFSLNLLSELLFFLKIGINNNIYTIFVLPRFNYLFKKNRSSFNYWGKGNIHDFSTALAHE